MRQRHGGPKIINWHRPLAPGEKKRKYLRFRQAHLSEDHLITPEEHIEAQGWKAYKRDHMEGGLDDLSLIDLAYHRVKTALQTAATPTVLASALTTAGFAQAVARPRSRPFHTGLIGALRDHLARLEHDPDYLPERTSEMLSETDWSHLREWAALAANCSDVVIAMNALARMILFSPFWIRSPLPPSSLAYSLELLSAHLFEHFEVPVAFRKEWKRYHAWHEGFDDVLQYILLTQGGSLRQAARHFRWDIPKKFPHFLLTLPAKRSMIHLKLNAYLLAHGVSQRIATLIVQDPGYVEEPTCAPYSLMRVIRFAVNTGVWLTWHESELSDAAISRILNWARHQFTELGEDFQWRGRTVPSTLRAVQAYEGLLRKIANGRYYWEASDIDWEMTDEHGSVWSFVELTHSSQLAEETRMMHHCVVTYGRACLAGDCVIVSVRRNGERILTIEIDPGTSRIRQIKGKCNREAQAEETHIVSLWTKEIVQELKAE